MQQPRTPFVPAEGRKDSAVALVGEAPGSNESRMRRPFVGGAGRVLDRALETAGLARTDCYITNVVKHQPVTGGGVPTTNFGVYYEDAGKRVAGQFLVQSRVALLDELAQTKAAVVVALGDEALRALAGRTGITKWRGSILWSEALQKKIIPTIHPAAVLREVAYYPLVCFDLKRAKEQSRFTALHRPIRQLVTSPTTGEVEYHINRMALNRAPVVFDIENDEGGELTCVGLSDSPHWALTVPCGPTHGVDYWGSKLPKMEQLVRELLEDPLVPKIAQNAQYDVLWLRHYRQWDVRPIVFDTMTAHHTVYPELPKGLGVLSSIYTEEPYHKGMLDENPGDRTELYRYNCLDAVVTYECYVAIQQELKELGVERFYYEYVLPLMWPLIEMQHRGVKIDVANRERIDVELSAELEDLAADFQVETRGVDAWLRVPRGVNTKGEEVDVPHPGLNPLSPLQLRELLYERLRLPVRTQRKSGTVTTDEKALTDLYMRYKHPALKMVLDIREKTKLLSTYVRAPLSDKARIHTAYVIGGTRTGRLASKESIFGWGTNLQNIPKGSMRKLFIPDPGLVMVKADLSQAEARIVAYLAGDAQLMQLFDSGGDVHRANAARIFKKDESSISAGERMLAKRLVHAANYGIGPNKFADVVFMESGKRLTTQEARALLDAYYTAFPRVKMWQVKTEDQLSRTRFLETPVGRKRYFMSWAAKDRSETMREALAFVPQSTVADVLNRGLLDLWERLHKVDAAADVLLQVHDEVVVQCRATHVKPVARLMRECLERKVRINGLTCQIPVDLATGLNWDECEELAI